MVWAAHRAALALLREAVGWRTLKRLTGFPVWARTDSLFPLSSVKNLSAVVDNTWLRRGKK